MDLADLMKEKRFLGQEFLTWIWFRSDVNAGLVELPEFGAVEIWFEQRMMLESGSGDMRQAVACTGRELDLAEALTALREGKKVSQVRLRVAVEEREWHLTLKDQGLELTGVKTPKTFDPDEEEPESDAGKLLERVALLQELIRILDALYAQFLYARLTDRWDNEELPRLRKWLNSYLDADSGI